jgi:selT/selW/selH-like putative selenoprotein
VEVELVRGGRGDFIVRVDGDVVWNKKLTGRFPDEAALVREVTARATRTS